MNSGTGTDPRKLAEEVKRLRAENDRLRRILDVRGPTAPAPEQVAVPHSPTGIVTDDSSTADKLRFYAHLFHARTDVYANRWIRRSDGRPQWSPATYGPPIKGRRPLEQHLRPLTPKVLYDHLAGDAFIGLYPLLPDETCSFLAADFDGPAALVDALAYVKAARGSDVPVALELSQSGRGAHVWFFFTEPVPAAIARELGLGLVHEAITLRGSMPLASYDRLFPNQATLQPGGIGNLIAAPLQGKCRKNRTTVFLNLATLEPWEDQWRYLSTLDRLTPKEVARRAKSVRIVVGAGVKRLARSHATAVHPAMPQVIHGKLGARLTVEAADLTPELAATLRHATTIANPAFYELERMHKWTGKTPRFLQGFDETPSGDLVLPRGQLGLLTQVVADGGSRLELDDERDAGREIDLEFHGELTPAQDEALTEVLPHDAGILVAPPGSGKTVMACAVIAERGVSTLILVDRKGLADQWRERLQQFLGIKAGQLGGGRTRLTGMVDVALLPTLARRDNVSELAAGYGQVIVDECHHVAAGAYEHSVKQIAARWWLGLTATPQRADKLDELVTWQLGPVRYQLGRQDRDATLFTAHGGPTPVLREHPTDFTAAFDADEPGAMANLQTAIGLDDARNDQIAADVVEATRRGRVPLVLTRRVEQIGALDARLRAHGPAPVVLTGRLTAAERRSAIESINGWEGPGPLVVLGTLPFVGEGFDAPVLDTVFLAAPISHHGLVVQAVGRVMRERDGKRTAEIHDYLDDGVPVLATMAQRRRRGYRLVGIETFAR